MQEGSAWARGLRLCGRMGSHGSGVKMETGV
jgi:hypothetical protein